MSCAYGELKPSALARAAYATFPANMPRWVLALLRHLDLYMDIHVSQNIKE